MLKQKLIGLLEIGIDDTELENGSEIKNLRWEAGYPTKDFGKIKATVDGKEVSFDCWLRELRGKAKKEAENKLYKEVE